MCEYLFLHTHTLALSVSKIVGTEFTRNNVKYLMPFYHLFCCWRCCCCFSFTLVCVSIHLYIHICMYFGFLRQHFYSRHFYWGICFVTFSNPFAGTLEFNNLLYYSRIVFFVLFAIMCIIKLQFISFFTLILLVSVCSRYLNQRTKGIC